MTRSASQDSARFFHITTVLLSVVLLAWAEAPFPGGPLGIVLLGGSILLLIKMALFPPQKPFSDALGYSIGALIALLGFCWIIMRLNYYARMIAPAWLVPADDLAIIPVQLAIIPCVGPLLPPLLIIKLRVRQLPRDFWVEQAMALVMVALSCVLCSDIAFGILLMVYFAVGMTALALREQNFSRIQCGFEAGLEATPHGSPSFSGHQANITNIKNNPSQQGQSWAPRIGRWFIWSFCASVATFFVLPRFDIPSWDPLDRFSNGRRSTTGFTNEVNINDGGELSLSDALAFTIESKGANGPAPLNTGQLFRGSFLDNYEKGVWSRKIFRRGNPIPLQTRSPSIPPGQTLLTFHVNPSKVGGVFLAEPMEIQIGSNAVVVPVFVQKEDRNIPTFMLDGLTVVPHSSVAKVKTDITYQQFLIPKTNPEKHSAFGDPASQQLAQLLKPRMPEMAFQALEALRENQEDPIKGVPGVGPLPNFDDLPTNAIWNTPRHKHEAIARALCHHLAFSNKFKYSLSFKRYDSSLDPAVDFLTNIREGHCELYASSLALMLRSLGIPSRMVVGYKGAEFEDEGNYIVRQRNAHAWVEALVPRLDPNGKMLVDANLNPIEDWLILDPTPENMAVAPVQDTSSLLGRLFQESQDTTEKLWRTLFIDYNPEAALEQFMIIWNRGPLRRALILMLGAWAIVLVGATGISIWRWYKRASLLAYQRSRDYPWSQLVRLVESRGMHPNPGQTPYEFAQDISRKLEKDPTLRDWYDLPLVLVESYQNSRYGNTPRESNETAVKQKLGSLKAKMSQTKW